YADPSSTTTCLAPVASMDPLSAAASRFALARSNPQGATTSSSGFAAATSSQESALDGTPGRARGSSMPASPSRSGVQGPAGDGGSSHSRNTPLTRGTRSEEHTSELQSRV